MATTSKLKEFISQVKNGGVMKTSRYSVFMSPPSAISGGVGDLRKLLLFCSEVQLPGVNVSTTQIRTFGEIREAPYERLFDNINMTFYVDQAMEVRYFFDKWVNAIQDTNTRTFNYYNDYVTDIRIFVEDARDDSRYKITLKECYPKSISAMTMGYDTKSEMKLQVAMNYKYWVAEPIAASTKKEPGPWDFLDKIPSINNAPPMDFITDFGGFQSTFNNTFPEKQDVTTGVTSIFTG